MPGTTMPDPKPRKFDWIIDTINDHPEWGVHAQYCTASEYLSSVRTAANATGTKFPVKNSGSNFFPYNDWSGYFTSRPSLKGNSQKAVSQVIYLFFYISPMKETV